MAFPKTTVTGSSSPQQLPSLSLRDEVEEQELVIAPSFPSSTFSLSRTCSATLSTATSVFLPAFSPSPPLFPPPSPATPSAWMALDEDARALVLDRLDRVSAANYALSCRAARRDMMRFFWLSYHQERLGKSLQQHLNRRTVEGMGPDTDKYWLAVHHLHLYDIGVTATQAACSLAMLRRLPALESLSLRGSCGNPQPIGGGFSRLTALELYNCTGHEGILRDMAAHHSLLSLDIGRCLAVGDFFATREGIFRRLQSLYLRRCDDLTQLPAALSEISTLRELGVQQCFRLTALAPSIGSLTGLEVLRLESCWNLLELPASLTRLSRLRKLTCHWNVRLKRLVPPGSQWTCFPRLQWLSLVGCTALQGLPADFTALAKLERLDLSACNRLDYNCCLAAWSYRYTHGAAVALPLSFEALMGKSLPHDSYTRKKRLRENLQAEPLPQGRSRQWIYGFVAQLSPWWRERLLRFLHGL